MSIARKSIQQQAAAEQAKIQSWRQQQQRDIDRQAEELRIQQRKDASEAEKQAQRNIAQADKAIETARKRRVIGIDTDRSALKEAKKEATKKQQELQAAAKEDKKELTTAEAEARAEIETLAKESEADIEAQKDVALKNVELFEEDNVELNTGEWIDRTAYEALDSEEQKLLMRLGISEYNKRKDAEFKQNNIQLKDGNWIDRTFYDELPSEQQTILFNEGIAGFEKWQQQQIQAGNEESWNSLQELITATGISSSVTFEQWQGMTAEQQQNTYDTLLDKHTVKVGNNEIVSSSWYESLSPEFQSIVDTSGATGLESYIADNYVTTKTEELIDKDYYNSLTTEQKDYIKQYGSQKFENKYYVRLSSTNELVDKKEYEALSPEVQKMLQEKGITETNNYIEKKNKEFKEFEDKHVKLNNGDYVDKIEYGKMTPQEQSLLRTLGVAGYNAKKQEEFKKAQEDYIKTLPKESQDYIKLYGLEKFDEAYQNALKVQEAGGNPAGTLKVIGLIPDYAENVTINKDGAISYEGSPNFRAAKVINLEKLDFNNLSEQDYFDVLKTVISKSEGKETKLDLWQIATHYNEYKQYFSSLSDEQKAAMQKIANKYATNKFINVLSFVFPPAQALKPEITIADIKGTEWAEGIANIGLLFVAPAVGAIGKAGSAAAKAASIASKGIQGAAITTYGVTTAVEWDNLSATEKVANIAINAVIALPLGKVATNALIAKLNPKGAAVKALIQNEKTIAKNFSSVLEKSYNSKVAQAFNNLSNIQSKYIKAVYKGSKAEEALALKLKNAADKFIKTLEKNVKKPLAEDREIVSAIKKLPDNIVQNTKEMVKLATQPKVSVKQLKKAVADAEKRFKAKKEKYPDKPEKWSEDYINLIDAELKLKHFTSTPIATKQQSLVKARQELDKLKSYKPKSKKERIKNINKINKLEAEIKKLESDILDGLKKADVEWVPDSSGYKGGGTAVATKPVETTRISGSLSTELKRKGRTLPSMGTGSGGPAAATTPAIQTSQVNAVSTQRVERTDGKVQEFVAPKTVTTKVAKTVPHTSTVTDAAFDTVTQQAIEAAQNAALQGATVPEIKTVASTAAATAIQTLPSTALQQSVKTQAAQIIKTAIKAAEKVRYTKRIPVKITDKDKEDKTPTPEQLAAAVGWKQGWAYWYIYPPAYGKGGKCRIIRKTPIKGIPLFKDAKSAYLSLTKIGKGELPRVIEIPMGITDLTIRTAKGGKPKSQYKRKSTSSIPRLRTTK